MLGALILGTTAPSCQVTGAVPADSTRPWRLAMIALGVPSAIIAVVFEVVLVLRSSSR